MLISKNWLSDFVALDDISNERLEELITTRVAEIDDLHVIAEPLNHAVVGKIVSVSNHPDKDNLKVCEVSIGDQTVSVVCGAPNATEGLLVPYIPPGGKFSPKGTEGLVLVETRPVGSVESQGVLVSACELQVNNDHSGLYVFDSGKPGDKVSSLLGEADLAIEIDNKSLTHRPDLWCHFGFARELSAILERPLLIDPDKYSDDSDDGAQLLKDLVSSESKWSVDVRPDSHCRRFATLEIYGVETIASPVWMQRRLFAVGSGIRNFLVDLSNYVMCDIGQPNHAYDLKALSGTTISARSGKSGEKFLGLDGVERTLSEEDIVIADEKQAVALGGVIGGELASVKDNTTSLLLESANFDPVVIRKMTKRHQLRTDASNRFEKSQSAYSVPLALHRFSELLKSEFGDTVSFGGISDGFAERPKSISVPFSYDFIRRRLGAEISDDKIRQILTGLHFELEESGSNVVARVPHFRATRDISLAEDLVEEIGRTFGYENIPEKAPLIESTSPAPDKLRESENMLRDEFTAQGYSEVSCYSFMGDENAKNLGYSIDDAVLLANSVSSEETLLRTTLVPGMLSVIERNSRYQSRFRLYELGRTYESQGTGIYAGEDNSSRGEGPGFERRMLSLAIVEPRDEKHGSEQLNPKIHAGGAFFSLLSVLRETLSRVYRVTFELEPCVSGDAAAGNYQSLRNWMHPYRACYLRSGDTIFGVLAEAHPTLLSGVDGRAVVSEVDVQRLCEIAGPVRHFQPIPKYPASLFEMSVVMPESTPYRQLEGLIKGAIGDESLRKLEVLSVYSGKPLNAGEKSISVKCWLGHPERTLSNEELTELQSSLMASIENSQFALRA